MSYSLSLRERVLAEVKGFFRRWALSPAPTPALQVLASDDTSHLQAAMPFRATGLRVRAHATLSQLHVSRRSLTTPLPQSDKDTARCPFYKSFASGWLPGSAGFQPAPEAGETPALPGEGMDDWR